MSIVKGLGTMHSAIKERWVEALRSGKYKQRTSSLYGSGPSGESFCCLGVLCTLAEEDGVIKRDEWAEDNLLPLKVSEWAGLGATRDPVINGSMIKAADANDSGASFDDIAITIQRGL